jgi:hypothetical protein
MSKRSSDWHITGWKAVVLLPIAIPLALPFALLAVLFGIGKYIDRSPEEVAGFIRDFIEDSGGEWDWDDFISVSIKDPRLEAIRKDATWVDPFTGDGLQELKKLLWRAEAIVSESRVQHTHSLD